MKQHISQKQLAELTGKERSKWVTYLESRNMFGKTYVLSNIGIMIEFLDEEQEKGSEVVTWIMLSKGSHSWSVGTFGNVFMEINGIDTQCPELCDALWECVKQVLENGKI